MCGGHRDYPKPLRVKMRGWWKEVTRGKTGTKAKKLTVRLWQHLFGKCDVWLTPFPQPFVRLRMTPAWWIHPHLRKLAGCSIADLLTCCAFRKKLLNISLDPSKGSWRTVKNKKRLTPEAKPVSWVKSANNMAVQASCHCFNSSEWLISCSLHLKISVKAD